MAKKKNNHKWVVGILMWLGILWSSISGDSTAAFVGIGVALAYMIYYVHG